APLLSVERFPTVSPSTTIARRDPTVPVMPARRPAHGRHADRPNGHAAPASAPSRRGPSANRSPAGRTASPAPPAKGPPGLLVPARRALRFGAGRTGRRESGRKMLREPSSSPAAREPPPLCGLLPSATGLHAAAAP